MPPRKKRKISFYYLNVENNLDAHVALTSTLERILEADVVSRKHDITENKIGFIDMFLYNETTSSFRILFKSAKHSFRPPLIDRITVTERDSPKNFSEGERKLTHIITKSVNGDVILLIEDYLGAVNINQLAYYLNYYGRQFNPPFIFNLTAMAKDNFLEEINSLSRVTGAEIVVDKQILGSQALNFSNRLTSVKHEVVISVKAENRNSIIEFARSIFARVNIGQQQVRRLKVTGRNTSNNEVIINTNFIERSEYVNPLINQDTGEIVSTSIFQEIEVIAHSNF